LEDVMHYAELGKITTITVDELSDILHSVRLEHMENQEDLLQRNESLEGEIDDLLDQIRDLEDTVFALEEKLEELEK
jgi:predicted nuclease with TOPRIM domain